VEELRALAPCALRCLAKPPEGPGPSRNLGARQARADIVAFTDSDCRADPGWLRHSLAAFADGVGLVQGKTLPDPAGSFGVFTRYPMNERESFVYECTNILYRREAFEKAGGFPADEMPRAQHPLGGEDVELAWAVKRNGWQSRFADASVVYHEVVQIPVWRWVFVKQLYVWPRLVKKFPELRTFFVARYFWDGAQALLALALLGIGASVATPWASLLCLPYAAYRGLPPSRSFPGPLRPLRIVPYLARDLASFGLLVAGSVRYRSVLL
jgi:glycosyltransferase involved in cell wall biosynthesis